MVREIGDRGQLIAMVPEAVPAAASKPSLQELLPWLRLRLRLLLPSLLVWLRLLAVTRVLQPSHQLQLKHHAFRD